MIKMAPSILSADFGCLKEDVLKCKNGGAEYIHCDIMDGNYVPQITFGEKMVKTVRGITDAIVDVHLMTTNPELRIEAFYNAGAHIITIHQEAAMHLDLTIRQIKALGIKCGVSLNPSTPISTLEYILEEIDMVMLMTVNPGKGGQSFIPYSLRKISDCKNMILRKGLNIPIEVDGGITLENVKQVNDAGADIIVAGSSVFGCDDIEKRIQDFLKICE